MSTRIPWPATASIAAGLAGAGVLAIGASATLHDSLVIVGLGLASSAVTAAVALLGLRVLRARSLGLHVAVIAVAAVATTAAGVALASWTMLLSGHDAAVVEMVLAVSSGTAGAVGIVTGAWYGRQLSDVEMLAADLAQGTVPTRPPAGTQVAEIAELRRRLVDSASARDDARAGQAALEQSRREFVTWVSHDLRSPIAAIRAMAESLEDGLVDEPGGQARYHRAIREETIRLGGLVDDLFELARLESGTPPTDDTVAPAAELIAETVDVIRPTAAARAVNLVTLADVGPVPVPAADVRRVLRNLLDNAVRHTQPGGSVVIDGDVVGAILHLSVTDECGGIPPHELGRVFEPAFRGDAARRRDTAGGGLGLAIAKGLVEGRGGAIVVANRGLGCRFALSLPVAPVPAATADGGHQHA